MLAWKIFFVRSEYVKIYRYLIGQSLHILYILYIFVSLSYLINLWQRLQLYFVCPSCIPFPHVPFHGLNLIELKGISTQNLLTKALWLQDFFFKSMIFLIRNFSQNWLIPNKIYFVIDLLYSLNTLLSKMSKCSSHCEKTASYKNTWNFQ